MIAEQVFAGSPQWPPGGAAGLEEGGHKSRLLRSATREV